MECIEFYGSSGSYGCFSNFFPAKVKLDGKIWPTSEHYFQAQKFKGTERETAIRKAVGPMQAKRMGNDRAERLRPDWESVKDDVMYRVVKAKFSQHDSLRKTLLATGNALIVEHTDNDTYWGDGGNGKGHNKLGKILVRVREELRREQFKLSVSGDV